MQMGTMGTEGIVRTCMRMMGGEQRWTKSRPLDLKPSIEPADIFHGDGELKPVGESDGILDPCVKERTLFTLVHRGRVMGKSTGIHGWLRTRGVGD